MLINGWNIMVNCCNNLLRAKGLTLLNITYPMLKYDRAGVAATVDEALVSRGVL